MAYQFIHAQTFGRKAGGRASNQQQTVAWVLDEAERLAGNCDHVEAPQAPTLVYGVPVAELRRQHDELVAERRAETATGQSRRIRSDQHTLMTEVASYPAFVEELDDPDRRQAYEAWRADTIAWWRERYGPDLVTVIEHTDEDHPHLHAYALPISDRQARAKELHPGFQAQRAAKENAAADGLSARDVRRRGDEAYKAEMRSYQSQYWNAVGRKHGLARIGPGRRRLTREQWKAEQELQRSVCELEQNAYENLSESRAALREGAAAKARGENAEAAAEASLRAAEASLDAYATAAEAVVDRDLAVRLQEDGQARAMVPPGGDTARGRSAWGAVKRLPGRLRSNCERALCGLTSLVDGLSRDRKALDDERSEHRAEVAALNRVQKGAYLAAREQEVSRRKAAREKSSGGDPR
jgi:hypothetical protein